MHNTMDADKKKQNNHNGLQWRGQWLMSAPGTVRLG